MTSDTNWLFVLKRVNMPGEHTLDKVDHAYTCGRAKTSQIMCISLEVSRHHCIFFRKKNEVYVTDLKSSNGLYINGIRQEPSEMIKLYPNEIIGIGCSELVNIDESMFVFKLTVIPQSPDSTNIRNSIDLPDTTLIVENSNNDNSNGIIKRKRVQNCNAIILPPKIPRLAQTNTILENVPIEVESDKDENSLVDSDVEILHTSLNNSALIQTSESLSKPTNKTSISNLSKNQRLDATESSNNNRETNPDPPPVDNRKKLVKLLASHTKRLSVPSAYERVPSVLNGNDKEGEIYIFDEARQKSVAQIQEPSKYNLVHSDNVERQVKVNKNCDLTSGAIEANNMKSIKHNVKSVNRCSGQSNVSGTEKPNDEETVSVTKDYDTIHSQLPSTFVRNEEVFIKQENELQLTDNDKNKILSPIKLKQVQPVIRTTFSENDVVNLSDSEDDIFPCSQLFDVGYGMDVSIKNELEEEPTEAENERLTASMHDDLNSVISLSDSEDENNNAWLRRLSQSQKLEDETDVRKVDDIKTEVTVVEPVVKSSSATARNEETNEKEITHERKTAGPLKMESVLNQVLLPLLRLERIDIPDNRSYKLTEDIKKHSAETDNLQKKDAEEKIMNKTGVISSKKKELLRKKVSEIEAPHLPPKRSRNCNKVIEGLERSERYSKLASTSKEQKEEQRRLEKLERREHAKEEKYRKQRHKWADCLPPHRLGSTQKLKFLSREEKEALSNDRKEKLKKIAIMEKRLSLEENQEKKRPVSKPKAKMTAKSRNDFLVEETISAIKPEDLLKLSKPLSSEILPKGVPSNDQNSSKSIKNPEASTEALTQLQNKRTLNNICNLGRIPKKSNMNIENDGAALNENRPEKTIEPKDTGLKDKSSGELTKADRKERSVPPGTNTQLPIKKSKKRVTFSEVLKTVREYEIDETNVLKRLVGKDAPMPRDKVVNTPVHSNSLYDEFLLRIFFWSPVWLEEQKRLKTTPPVINVDKELNQMLTSYRAYEEYYRTITPLLLIEIWCGITKEYQSEQICRRTFVCSIVENSVSRVTLSHNICFTSLMIALLVSKEDMRLTTHPVYGDLVMIEYAYNHEKKGQSFHRVFGFVTQVDSRPLTSQTRFNKALLQHEKNAHALNTYTVLTRPLTNNILVNRFIRLRTVSYLRSTLRMVKALQYLPNSPLMNQILSPKLDMYKLPDVISAEPLVTEDKLNQKQMEAVVKITQAVVQKESKLCLIHGPPGTGKSRVIVNIIMQILYGSNRYTTSVGNPFKILVCAPTNAAIDEIVLRLLDIRSNIKQKGKMKPFRMVRIGRAETMHPLVKDISVSTLADRDLRKTATTSNNVSPQSVQDEKALLELKINTIKCQLTSISIDETYKRNLNMKLEDIVARYDSLVKPRLHMSAEEHRRLHRSAENRLLEYANIITCTLTSCCTNQMETIFGTNKNKISVCIVDEATQSSEPETLIPLMLGVNTMILVGDPDQLPATIISPEAKKFGLGRSLFSRVQSAFDVYPDNPVIMLNTQYRMQPDICCWPNKFFYGGKLVNGVECDDKFPFYSYRILDLKTNQNNDNFSNDNEADFIANVIYSMLTSTNLEKWNSCISCGILTPYNNQKVVIQTKIKQKISSLSEVIKKKIKIEINTVDGFQGQERDIILMSCVRSQKIGFLSDKQRLCVALTRAKHCLIICGNFNVFKRDDMWSSLLSNAKSRKMYFKVNAKAEPPEIRSYIVRHIPEPYDSRTGTGNIG
ncbi:uncharacterized protein LOC108626822 [Ceratina calcarata]|uniref:Uncharacterized protein LOC108626822 n=1 Tax=Ceratina calcarata TaxID=156304 RepID=A0AAJ7J2F7_9HYME|nr:uncharacterized protein LOC108626822 [Ceratina calcarata]